MKLQQGDRIELSTTLTYWDDATQTEKTVEAGEYEIVSNSSAGWKSSQEPKSVMHSLSNVLDGTVHHIHPNDIEDWKKQGLVSDDIF